MLVTLPHIKKKIKKKKKKLHMNVLGFFLKITKSLKLFY